MKNKYIRSIYKYFAERGLRNPIYWKYNYQMCKECLNHAWAYGNGYCIRHVQSEQILVKKINKTVSWESRVEPDRVVYAKDLIQPFKADATVNPEYIKAYKKDPRKDEAHRNNPRNINNRYAAQNYEVNREYQKWEKKKYGI